jgi:hypothetical protein
MDKALLMAKPNQYELNSKLDEISERGMEITGRWVSVWKESLQYFFSHQLAGVKKRKNWDWIVINYIWPSAMQEVAKLSKNFPKMIAEPWETSDQEAAEVWQSSLNWQWRNGINGTGMRLEQIYAILCAKIFGYCVSKVFWEDKCYWDGKQKLWMGDLKHKLWHPALFWADGTDKIQDGNCGTQRWVTAEWAQARWPKFAKQIEDEATEYKPGTTGAGGSIYGSYTAGSTTTRSKGDPDGGPDNGPLDPPQILNLIEKMDPMSASDIYAEQRVVCVEELYLHNYEEKKRNDEEDIAVEELVLSGRAKPQDDGTIQDSETNEPIGPDSWPKRVVREYDEPVYPNGQYVIRIGKTILNPDPIEQVWPYSKWPFVVKPHYLLPFAWQGLDAVQMYKTTQDMINVTASHLTNNMKMFGDPKIAIEEGAIAVPPGSSSKAYSIGSAAGSIIRLVRGGLNKFKILDPPQMSQASLALYELFTQEYKNITGLQSIAKGEKAPGKMTATEAQWLAISSNDRISLQSAFEDQWVKGISCMMVEIMQLNYDQGRFIRIVGDDSVVGVTQITQQLKEMKFDIDIIPGTTLPFDEEKRKQDYLQAYQLLQGPPNPMLPELLRQLGVPKWKQMLEQHETFQMFLQLQQLYEGVKSGQITPEQATQMIYNTAMGVYQKEQAKNGGMPPQSTGMNPASGQRDTSQTASKQGAESSKPERATAQNEGKG